MPRVDRTALRVNQALIVALLVLAFIMASSPAAIWLVAFVMAVMAVGTVFPRFGLFKAIYLHGLKPVGLLSPSVVQEDPAQHLFAQGMGACVLLVALILLGPAHAVLAGWATVWLVIALALVNLVFGFCAGCFIYTQLELRRVFRPSEARQT